MGLKLIPMCNTRSYLKRRNLLLIDVFLQLGHFVDPASQVPRESLNLLSAQYTRLYPSNMRFGVHLVYIALNEL